MAQGSSMIIVLRPPSGSYSLGAQFLAPLMHWGGKMAENSWMENFKLELR